MVKVKNPYNRNSWITPGIRTSCQHKTVLYLKLQTNSNPALKKYFKNYCRILTTLIKAAKRLGYDRQIMNSNNAMRMSWKLTNKERSKNYNQIEVQSLDVHGRITTDCQIIANTFNNHFTTFPITITQKITDTDCTATTTNNKQNNKNNTSLSINHIYKNSFPNIKFKCTTTEEIEL